MDNWHFLIIWAKLDFMAMISSMVHSGFFAGDPNTLAQSCATIAMQQQGEFRLPGLLPGYLVWLMESFRTKQSISWDTDELFSLLPKFLLNTANISLLATFNSRVNSTIIISSTHEAMIQSSKLQSATGSEAETRRRYRRITQPSKVCVFQFPRDLFRGFL